MNPIDNPDERPQIRLIVVRCFLAILVIVVLVGAWCVYAGISTSLEAEHTLHATILVYQVIGEFVEKNDGDWPDSWDALTGLPARSWGMWKWPDDVGRIQKRVAIDFEADPDQLALQSSDEFDAITPIGPHYSSKDSGNFLSMMNAIRTTRRSRE